MTGYQEILTDPSYRGQIVTMTYTQIGNYGINAQDVESHKPHLAGFIVRENSRRVSNFRADGDLSEYLARYNIVGLAGIDTRALVRRIRTQGAMKGVLSSVDLDDASLVAKAQASPGLVGRDLVREVMPEKAVDWTEPLSRWARLSNEVAQNVPADAPHIVALDYGMKWNIARHLFDLGCRVTILPGTATADEVLAQKPDGVFLSNGPGDPEPLDLRHRDDPRPAGQEADLRHLPRPSTPGAGLRREDLQAQVRPSRRESAGDEQAHRQGRNHHAEPRFRGRSRLAAAGAGNHASEPERQHRSKACGTRKLPAFSVQYHPEASAGPHDSGYLFGQFREMLG